MLSCAGVPIKATGSRSSPINDKINVNKILGIESSCDETGIALYDTDAGLLAHKLHSQVERHRAYGGVVPELASRDHLRYLLPLIQQTLDQADLPLQAVDGVAYTAGPGLAGALLVGAASAKALAWALGVPAMGVHHLEGHLLSPMLDQTLELPCLCLLVSGGHTQLIEVRALGEYHNLGQSLDDAVGESFDKIALLLGLDYPGGSALEQLAQTATGGHYQFPLPMTDRPGCDMSFSGLKTHTITTYRKAPPEHRAEIAHAFQHAVIETLLIKTWRALQETGLQRLVISGGVSANRQLRRRFTQYFTEKGVELIFPTMEFCTDNGAMIALVGAIRLANGEREQLEINVRPRWPLENLCKIAQAGK